MSTKKYDLKIIKEYYLTKLQGDFSEHLKMYENDKMWINEHFNSCEWDLSSGFSIDDSLKLLEPNDKSFYDLENSIIIHKAFPELSLVQAADPRFWVKLAHVEFWKYMRKRWPVEKHEKDVEKMERFILTRYFISQNQSRSLIRQGISRLWWAAKLTHDQNRENPYELTSILFSSLDISLQILERNIGRVPTVLTGFLEVILRNKEELLDDGNDSRMKIRQLAKNLNQKGGVCLLDCLDQSEINSFLNEELKKIRKAS